MQSAIPGGSQNRLTYMSRLFDTAELKLQSSSQHDLPCGREGLDGADHAHRTRCGDVRGGVVEVRVIEDVLHGCFKGEPESLGNREPFGDGEVVLMQAGRLQDVNAAVAEAACRWPRERRRIEPPGQAPIRAVQVAVSYAVGEPARRVGVRRVGARKAGAEVLAGLQVGDPIELPTA